MKVIVQMLLELNKDKRTDAFSSLMALTLIYQEA